MRGLQCTLFFILTKEPPLLRFTGEDPEPRPGLSSGHIPNSFSLPFTTFLQTNTYTPDGQSENKTYTTFLPPNELLKVLTTAVGPANAQAVVEGRRSVIASCGSGMTAGVIWLALRILGAERVGIYDEVCPSFQRSLLDPPLSLRISRSLRAVLKGRATALYATVKSF